MTNCQKKGADRNCVRSSEEEDVAVKQNEIQGFRTEERGQAGIQKELGKHLYH